MSDDVKRWWVTKERPSWLMENWTGVLVVLASDYDALEAAWKTTEAARAEAYAASLQNLKALAEMWARRDALAATLERVKALRRHEYNAAYDLAADLDAALAPQRETE